MNEQVRLVPGQRRPVPPSVEERLLRWGGRLFYLVALAGMVVFGSYILLRASGATFKNFEQWRPLLDGSPTLTVSDWVASIGIGMHFAMAAILLFAWPILFSATIRARHRVVHRWTGRVYVSAGFLAGCGGLSFIFAHGAYTPSASIAFGIWGAVMMLSAVMAYVHARARRFDRHRAWVIRLFAVVLGSWLFDLEFRAWKDFTGGAGIGQGSASGLFDYALLYLFFVPNLLVAEFFIRNKHKRLALSPAWRWPVLGGLATVAAVFIYAVVMVSATGTGKYGRHLLQFVTG